MTILKNIDFALKDRDYTAGLMTTRATILHQFTTLDRLREFPKVRQNRQSNLVPVSNSSVGGEWWMVNGES